MALDDVVRNAIRIIDRLTQPLQVTVAHHRWNGVDAQGMPTFASAVNRKALVVREARRVRMDTGEETVSQTRVTFLAPIAPLVVAESSGGPRHNPVDKRDRIDIPLPGGGTMTGPILVTRGMLDAGAAVEGQPFHFEVLLG